MNGPPRVYFIGEDIGGGSFKSGSGLSGAVPHVDRSIRAFLCWQAGPALQDFDFLDLRND